MRRTEGTVIRRASFVLVIVLAVCAQGARADFAFGPAASLGPVVNRSDDGSPSISADGLSLYFDSGRSGGFGGYDIWVTTRASALDLWGPPANLGSAINTGAFDGQPCPSSDGLSLFFASDRPGGQGGMDIWVATRIAKDASWGNPVNLGPIVNAGFDNWDWSPSITADGLSLFLCSTRSGGLGGGDVWVTTRASIAEPWGQPVNLGAPINSSYHEAYAGISADGRQLVLSEGDKAPFRPGGLGGGDIWVASRVTKSGPWGTPVNVGPNINTEAWDVSADLSPDGSTLYSCSFLGGVLHLTQAPIIPICDFNGDGKVDIKDLLRLIESWGGDDPSVDMGPMPWGDGTVDKKDLEVLMCYWQQDVNDPRLAAHWKLDETDGIFAADSILANNGMLIGNPIWQPVGGQLGGALQLDGMGACVSTPFVSDPSEGPFSVFAWVQGGASGQVIVSQEKGANWLMIAPTGALMTELKSPGRFGKSLISQMVITDGQWHRVGFVWDGSNRILYLDGVEVATDTQTTLAGTYAGLHIGAGATFAPGTFWKGLIDDVRIYDRAVAP